LVATLALLAACAPQPQDATERPVKAAPARRIVTLAPHLAELVYAAGAGERLVGVAEFSDYPPAVRQLPRIGDAFRVDAEALLALEPDLVLGWASGNPAPTIAQLRSLKLHVVTFEPRVLRDVADHIEAIGELAGTTAVAGPAATAYRNRLAALEQVAAGRAPVRVFVQLASQPYYTVTDRHFLSQGLALCGGRNVFGDLAGLTAVVSAEAVVTAAPAAIIASDMGGAGGDPLADWRGWPSIPAVAAGELHLVNADLLSRPSLRILDGIAALCELLGGMP
jgi:iron complex transport system substrate-binding protein